MDNGKNYQLSIANYQLMKDSGIDWLGYIPAHWEVLANKYIFKLKKNQVGKKSDEYDLLSLTLRGIIKRDLENPEGKFPAEFDTYQEVKKGDFVFCLFDVEETPRTVGLSQLNGMITGAYTVMESSPNFDKKFLYYFYLNLDSRKQLKPLYRGLRNTIPKNSFMSFKTFVPPLAEQTAIADFLDRKTGQIDAFVALKEKTIALLEEQKTAIINAAVTQGLNPAAPLKDSGIEWLGEVPAHWEVKPLAWVARLQRGHDLPNSEREDGPFPIISSSGVSGYHSVAKAKGPGVVTGRYGTIGKIIYVESDYWPLNTSLYVIEFYGNYPRYIYYMLQILPFDAHSGKSAVPGVNRNDLHVLSVVCPPLSEQRQIVAHIEQAVAKIDRAIGQAQQQIELIKEYRESLISQAVTGKIKVIDN